MISYWQSALLGALSATSLSACGPPSPANYVVVPQTDLTPPTVGMLLNDNKSFNVNVDQDSAPVSLHAMSDTLTVISGTTDNDGGALSVELWGTFTYMKPGQVTGPALVGAPLKQDAAPASIGDSVLKNRAVSLNIDLKKELAGWTSIKLDIWTVGKNYAGLKVQTPIASVTYP